MDYDLEYWSIDLRYQMLIFRHSPSKKWLKVTIPKSLQMKPSCIYSL